MSHASAEVVARDEGEAARSAPASRYPREQETSFYPLACSSRPANVIVRVADNTAEAVAAAIKQLRRKADATGLSPLLKRGSRLYAYSSPGRRRRERSGWPGNARGG